MSIKKCTCSDWDRDRECTCFSNPVPPICAHGEEPFTCGVCRVEEATKNKDSLQHIPLKQGEHPPRKYFAYYFSGANPYGPLQECSRDRFESGDTSVVEYLSKSEHLALLAEERAKGETIGRLKEQAEHYAFVISNPGEHHATVMLAKENRRKALVAIMRLSNSSTPPVAGKEGEKNE